MKKVLNFLNFLDINFIIKIIYEGVLNINNVLFITLKNPSVFSGYD